MRPLPLPRAAVLAATFALALVAAPRGRAQEKVPQVGTDRFRIRYADGTVSINDWCPVGNRALGKSQIPLYVNGEPVGFC